MDTQTSDSMTIWGEERYESLDPRGELPEVESIPLTPRISDLNDKLHL
ncbi:hypothetical protein ACFL7M_05350 [Thermodesulfobacteriota bacterium]